MTTRRQMLASLGAAAVCPSAIASTPSSIPITQDFPAPKFHFGQKVENNWSDEFGNTHSDQGIVIGMLFETADYKRFKEWCYLISWTKNETSPWIVDSDDSYFLYERELRAV